MPPRPTPDEVTEALKVSPRSPVQERGRRRLQQLLDAAVEIFVEVGVDNATTNAIAARANTSVGLLYKFFPNKQAIVEALAETYLAQIEALIIYQEQEGIAAWPLRDAIEWLVRATLMFHQENPAFHHVLRALRSSNSEKSAALLDRTKHLISNLLQLRAAASSAARDLHASVGVEAAHALIVHACTQPEPERHLIVEETVKILTRYLEPEYRPPARQAL